MYLTHFFKIGIIGHKGSVSYLNARHPCDFGRLRGVFYSSDDIISFIEITPSEYADISNSKTSFISLFCFTQATLKFVKISGLIVVTNRLRSTFAIQSFLSVCYVYYDST